jgi:hypothetical protein
MTKAFEEWVTTAKHAEEIGATQLHCFCPSGM